METWMTLIFRSFSQPLDINLDWVNAYHVICRLNLNWNDNHKGSGWFLRLFVWIYFSCFKILASLFFSQHLRTSTPFKRNCPHENVSNRTRCDAMRARYALTISFFSIISADVNTHATSLRQSWRHATPRQQHWPKTMVPRWHGQCAIWDWLFETFTENYNHFYDIICLQWTTLWEFMELATSCSVTYCFKALFSLSSFSKTKQVLSEHACLTRFLHFLEHGM